MKMGLLADFHPEISCEAMQCSQLRIPLGHSSGLGGDCGSDLIPGLGALCAEGQPERKQKEKKDKKE